jgi:hypothetical protein
MQAEIDGHTVLETEDYKKVRKAFFKAVDKGLAYCVNGDPGTGKTFSLKKLSEELREARCQQERTRPPSHLRARPLEHGTAGSASPNLQRQRRDLVARPDRPAAAQDPLRLLQPPRGHHHRRSAALFLGCLETVRELLDEPPHFGLIFAGSHDVENKFNQIQMEQWRRRLQNTIVLQGLQREEATES